MIGVFQHSVDRKVSFKLSRILVCELANGRGVSKSINLLVDSVSSYNTRCLKGIEADKEQIAEYLKRSLMLVTALNPIIGYDQAAEIAQKAFKEDITLKKSALRLGYLTETEFEDYIQPQKMTKANLK